MRYLFSKNKASDISEAEDKISEAIVRYQTVVLNPHDTAIMDVIAVWSLAVGSFAGRIYFLLISGLRNDSVTILNYVIGMIITFIGIGFSVTAICMCIGGYVDCHYGLIGQKMNEHIRKNNPELSNIRSRLEQICDRLKVIEKMVAISNDVEKLHERYGDDLTINISGLPDNYCDVTFTCCIERNIGKQLTYTDKISKNYRMNRSFAAKIFIGDTVDFSWLDGKMDGVKEDLCREILTISDNKNSAKVLEDKIFKKIVGRITMKPYNDKIIKIEFDKSSPKKFSLEDKNDGLDCYRHEYNKIVADRF